MKYPGKLLLVGDSGEAVKYIKECLYSLGYLSVKPTRLKFGTDTEKAVKLFQKENKDIYRRPLDVDGKIGELTWGSIIQRMEIAQEEQSNSESADTLLKSSNFPKILPTNLKLINDSLKSTTPERYRIVKYILGYARDAEYDKDLDPTALYIYGANLIDTKLNVQLANQNGFIQDKASKNPQYFDGGRKEWMEAMCKKFPNIAASDCSGMIVGFLRLYKYESNTFDKSANELCGDTYSKVITKTKLKPGDWVGFSGHIAVFVGGKFIVEFAGGAYGCQLTDITNRKLRNLMTGVVETPLKTWIKFREPKYY